MVARIITQAKSRKLNALEMKDGVAMKFTTSQVHIHELEKCAWEKCKDWLMDQHQSKPAEEVGVQFVALWMYRKSRTALLLAFLSM